MSSALRAEQPGPVRSLVPARMDRLPWTRFHWLVIIGLGVSWILDGLEIQIASTVGSVLTDKHTLHITTGDVGTLGSVYSNRGSPCPPRLESRTRAWGGRRFSIATRCHDFVQNSRNVNAGGIK